MPGDRVVRQTPQQGRVVAHGRVLERPDAEVARRNPDEHRARLQALPHHLFTGGHHCQRPGGGDPEHVERFADQELAQHRPEDGLAVAASGEWSAPGALQVHVAMASMGVEHLTEQQCAAVTESRRQETELMTGVRLRHG